MRHPIKTLPNTYIGLEKWLEETWRLKAKITLRLNLAFIQYHPILSFVKLLIDKKLKCLSGASLKFCFITKSINCLQLHKHMEVVVILNQTSLVAEQIRLQSWRQKLLAIPSPFFVVLVVKWFIISPFCTSLAKINILVISDSRKMLLNSFTPIRNLHFHLYLQHIRCELYVSFNVQLTYNLSFIDSWINPLCWGDSSHNFFRWLFFNLPGALVKNSTNWNWHIA